MATRVEAGHAGGRGAGWGWILAYGIVSVVVGIAAFGAPVAATVAATYLVGFALLIVGFGSLVAGIRGRGAEARTYKIAFGVLTELLGLAMLLLPIAGAISLTMLLAVWLGVRGVLEIAFGARHRRHRLAMIALGVVNVLLAVYVVVMLPVTALTLPGYILGVSFLAGGIVAIMQALGHRAA